VAQRRSGQREYVQREPGQREAGQRPAGQRESAPREPVVEDKFADVEILSPIELALKRAMEASGKTVDYNQDKGTKKNSNSRNRARAMQEEAMARTLGGRNR